MDPGECAANSAVGFVLIVKRNCSISPSGILRLLGLVMAVCFGIGIGFAWFGAWMILPFAGLEMLALTAAFYLNGRHAADYERIALCGADLVVEVREGDTTDRRVLHAGWTRLAENAGSPEYRLALQSNGREIEIGRHLDPERRRELAAVLRKELERAAGHAHLAAP